MPSAKLGGFKKDAQPGKFLVIRRDGTVPDWTWCVLGAADPYAPAALRAMASEILAPPPRDTDADRAQRAYARDLIVEADSWVAERYCRAEAGKKRGDPEAGPHRVDNERILKLMRGEITFAQIEKVIDSAILILAGGGPVEMNRLREALAAVT